MSINNPENCVMFVPSRVEGMDSVNSVTVEPEFIVFDSVSGSQTYRYADFAKHQHNNIQRIICCLLFRAPGRPMIGERDWFQQPADRFFKFYTEPLITVYMPKNDPTEYQQSTFYKVQMI